MKHINYINGKFGTSKGCLSIISETVSSSGPCKPVMANGFGSLLMTM